ncbi:dolichol-phosphate mannosyltransferase [Actinoplanes campanulatus]|uniref:Dolichol-phosphate mannosyltransferase n=1 Tax=Actinoplanes campanulatus TaxID=113559 RepID=A0A7W5AAX3_9ACTN|nr:glycosyltransferase [Actinoplanes campanulatus]MBB3092856.1 dolichol-phosphate mannosyltransferase [Actinoplanes campanulatus]GGM99470.1 dolichol monophosphate mannose synthase [Actinoplanes campanulatus]GID34046.1 dolichol monophosphate mannose synthase [Actinoplanes campanulatus]
MTTQAQGRAAVGLPHQATATPGEKTLSLDRNPKPGRTRAVLPGQIGVLPAPTTLRQSIIVPTFNERDNVAALLERLAAALPHDDTEIVFVDDSTDGTPEVIAALAADYPIAVTVHHRDEGVGGLGGAVVEGMRIARGEWIVVMDADLQHPPEIVPDLIAAGLRDGADLVVGSRYTNGGSTGGLADGYRKLVSRGSTLLVKTLFRNSLLAVSDPMSGLFAIRASSLDAGQLRPLGYKILLELVVRNRPGRVVEVPYTFQTRHAGESKSTAAEGIRFLKHVAGLRFGPGRLRMLAFALIGLSGLLPNQAVLWALLHATDVHYTAAAVMANVVAVVWNFALTDTLLYRNHRRRAPLSRFGRFFLMGNADLLLRIPLLALLVSGLHLGVLAGNLLTLVTSFAVRFLISDRLIYRAGKKP